MTPRILAILSLSAAAAAQTVTVPPGAAGAEQASLTVNPISSSNIQGVGVANRSQWVYDAANFPGITTPILITRMQLRANGVNATWSGATINNMVIDLSTSPADYLAMVNVFDSNHGADRTQVWNAAATVQAGSSVAATNPNPPGGGLVVDFDLIAGGTPFAYNPALGDLVIDFMSSGINGTVTGAAPNLDAQSTGALARRSFTNLSQFAASGTTPSANAMVIEFTYQPISGVYVNFTASPRAGVSPLTVNFTDQSSSGAGPLAAWAWDFENDGIFDAFVPNPTHTYPCGTFSVRLQVSDGVNPPLSVVRTDFVITDQVTASFTWQATAAGQVQFTDTTTPAATAWSWDFNGDNIPDSTLQNPTWSFGDCLPHDVTLTASRSCGPNSSVTNRVVAGLQLETTYVGGSSGATNWANLFDLQVLNPNGIEICGLDLRTNTGVGTAFNVDIYVTPTTVVGNESNNTVWRRVAQGSGVSGGNSSPNQVRSYVNLSNGIYLAPGSYGVMIHHVGGSGQTYSGSTTQTNFANADVAFSNPRVRAGLFSGTLFTPRTWNGTLYYATCNTSNEASYGLFDLGCPGSMGVPGNVGVSDPRLGSTASADITNLPINAAILVLGLSRTNSVFGPLPVLLDPFGLTGCFGRVSADSTQLLLGAGNTATWSLPLPVNPTLLCGRFYTQALVLDPGFNAAGATMSDAAAAVIGQ